MSTAPPAGGAPVRLFDSLTRVLQPFSPLDPAMVRLYSCGPTVYHHAHLGNLRAYVFTDTLRRMLNWKGWATNHVINITDVGHLVSDADAGEDKMELAATRSGRTAWDIAAFYTAAFKADLARLGVLAPSLWSVATDHVQDMIAFARTIEAHGAAYQLADGLYFDTARVPDYGALAGERPDDTVARIAEVAGKRRPADFALWRRSPEGETRQMEWQSPWGPGAPGWHLECSVMSLKYLGAQFDIHTGGIDHREVHHPNEIAQNQAYHCSAETGANLWMHNNFLVDRVGKMSKSSGAFLTLQAVIDRGIHPLAYRLLCLSAHYRSELEFSWVLVQGALTRLKRLVMAVEKLRATTDSASWVRPVLEAGASRGASFAYQRSVIEAGLSSHATDALARFDEAVADDLGTPRALAVLEEAVADKRLPTEARLRVIASMDLVLGLGLLTLNRADLRLRPDDATITAEAIEERLAERRQARADRDFARGDAIRDALVAAGVEVMDGDPLGWDWQPRLD